MHNDIIIEAHNLNKSFGDVNALVDFSLNVKRGEISGVVGPDGAGKTTLMRILSTVSPADSGTLTLDSIDAVKHYQKARSSLGYMSQKFGLYQDMSVSENIDFYATIQGVSKTDIEKRKETLLKASGMYQFKDRLAGKLSGGMKQKLALCSALIHEPKVLILDEPTNGVDPVSRREFWQILNRFTASGTAVVYATSYLDEAERCNTINLVNKGQVLAYGTPDELKNMEDINVIEIKGNKTRDILNAIPSWLGKAWSFGSSVHIHSPKSVTDVNAKLIGIIGNSYEISIITPTLEDVFTYLTSEGYNDE